METQNSEVYQIWAKRITLTTTLIVVGLSWLNDVTTLDLIIRGGISFGIMYSLMAGILSLFKNTASEKNRDYLKSSAEVGATDMGRGGVIDFSVGDEGAQLEIKPKSEPEFKPSNFAGQVDPNLSKGLPGSAQQAEIGRRMGWNDEHK
ncbi:MAG TPA: hypothetical protein VFC84_06640 [Desulfosporosinus sp.]|nr:hypothetical protein [Desulfosporosinus sp.]